jgi:hypothetical protein
MATYRLKRKYFGLAAAADTGLKALGGGSKGWGIFAAGSMGVTAVQGKKQRAEAEVQNQQTLQEQKERLNQLNSIAKS